MYWCQITGYADYPCFPADCVFLSFHFRKKIFSSVIIIKGLAVVFWKVPIILTFLSHFLFLFEKKAMIESKPNKNPHLMIAHGTFCLFQYLSSKWGRTGILFFPQKCLTCSSLNSSPKIILFTTIELILKAPFS